MKTANSLAGALALLLSLTAQGLRAEEYDGRLDDRAARFEGRLVAVYTLTVTTPGLPLNVELSASDFGPMALLVSPSGGVTVASISGVHASLSVAEPETGAWRLLVTSLEEAARGSYRLSVTPRVRVAEGELSRRDSGVLAGLFRSRARPPEHYGARPPPAYRRSPPVYRDRRSEDAPPPPAPAPAPAPPAPAPEPAPPPVAERPEAEEEAEEEGDRALEEPQESVAVQWNSWIVRTGVSVAPPVVTLSMPPPGQSELRYTVHFDLAGLAYRALLGEQAAGVRSSPADALWSKELRQLYEQGFKTYELGVDAVALGGVRLVRAPREDVVVDLEKLMARRDSEKLRADLEGKDERESIDFLSEELGTGKISVEVGTLRPGCGAVALTLRQAGTIRPVDQVIRTMEVSPFEGGTSPGCDPVAQSSEAFTSGLVQLLHQANGPVADAALHLFEVPLEDRTYMAAFYIDANHRLSWAMKRSLEDYLGDEQNLTDLVRAARLTASKNEGPDYSRAGLALSRALFTFDADYPGSRESATEAQAALKAVAEASDEARVLIRLVGHEGNPLPVPLGLLGVGKTPVLPKPIRALVPLKRDNFLGGATCISAARLAVPRELQGATLDVPEAWALDDGWLNRTDDSLKPLRAYLGTDEIVAVAAVTPPAEGEAERAVAAPPPAEPPGELFVLAAHHGRGLIRYRDGEADPIQADTINHKFGRGSVAVLSVCEAGGVDRADALLVERLNEMGVEAMILSPFTLQADYGKGFAIAFGDVTREALAAGRADTLAQLFKAASERTAARLNAIYPRNYDTMAHELLIAGNPALRLCKPGEGR